MKSFLAFALGVALCASAAVEQRDGVCQVSLDLDRVDLSSPSPITLSLRPLSAATAAHSHRSEIRLSDSSADPTIEVPLQGIWQIDLQSETLWAPDNQVSCSLGNVTLPLFPAGWVHGTFEPGLGMALPTGLKAKVTIAAEADDPQANVPSGVVDCRVDQRRWSCRVPAAASHLRLEPAGYRSHFLWDQRLAAGQDLDVGTLPLKLGGRVVGEVRTTDGTALDATTVVRAISGSASQSDGSAPPNPRNILRSAQPTEDGYFHLQGLAPGPFFVEVVQHGFSPSRGARLDLGDGETANLPEPLLLRRPLQLTVKIDPSADGQDELWQVLVVSPGRSEFQRRKSVDADGVSRFGPLAAGSYALVVFDHQNNGVAQQKLHLTKSQTVTVEVGKVIVEGIVTLGGKPLAATLFFGGQSNALKVKTYSSIEGRFRVTLPRAGSWPVDVRAVEPSVFRRLREVDVEAQAEIAELTIDLPATSLRGQTVDPDGALIARAAVLLVSEQSGEPVSHLNSDEEGQFEFAGLPAGKYKVQAFRSIEGERWSSAQITAELVDGGDLPVVLDLRPPMHLSGVVIEASMGPVAGAEISVLPLREDGSPGLLFTAAVSSEAGEFEVAVPRGGRIELTVQVPGFALYRRKVRSEFSKTVQVELSRTSGTLILELDREPTVMTQPIVIFAGESGFPLSFLQRWAAQNQVFDSGLRVEVPSMPPGAYEACWPIDTEEEAGRTCVEGYLLGGSSLTLRSPLLASE